MMVLEKIVYRLLVISMLLTVISGKIELPIFIRYANTIVLICISAYYFIFSGVRYFNSNFQIKLPEFIAGVLFAITCAFLAIIQSVHTTEVLTSIKILAILNIIYSIFLKVRMENKNLTIKHYIITFLLIGVGVFIPVS
jgi:hypothetical protein